MSIVGLDLEASLSPSLYSFFVLIKA